MKEIFKGMLSGGYSAKVYLDFKGFGSSVDFPNDEESFHIIKIGAGFPEWDEVYDGILHEMMEFHMCNMELTFQRWYRAGGDSGDIWFHMNHAEYSECISRASQSILCFVDIAKKEFDIHIKKVHTTPNKSKKLIKEDATNERDNGSKKE